MLSNHCVTYTHCKRALLRALSLSLTFLAVAGSSVFAADFPSKPVRLIVGYPPGGSNDLAARIIAPELGRILGQPIVVENMAGANGVIGASYVVKAEPDGYTLLLSSMSPIVLAPQTMKAPPFNAPKDLSAVNMMALTPEAIAIGPRRKDIKTLSDLIDAAKKGPVTLSSSGSGGLPHLTIELLKKVQGNFQHVPYKGAGPAINDTIAGHVDGVVMDLAPLYAQIQSGKLTALAVTSEKRVDFLKDVPTAQEFLPGLNVVNWVGIFAPAKTPAEVLSTLDRALQQAVANPRTKEAFDKAAMSPTVLASPTAFQRLLSEDYARWGKVLKEAGVEMN